MLVGRSECAWDEREGALIRRYGSHASYEGVTIYKGSKEEANKVIYVYGKEGNDYGEYTYPICIKPEQYYTVEYTDSSGSWASESFVRILIDNAIIYEGSLGNSGPLTDTFTHHECKAPDTLATISIQYGNFYDYQSLTLVCGDATHVFNMIEKTGQKLMRNRLFSYGFCYGPNKVYAVVSSTSYDKTLTSDSYVQVLQGKKIIIKSFFDNVKTGSDFFFYYPPCTPSEVEATVTRYYGRSGSYNELYDIYKGDVESGMAVFYGKGDDNSNNVTSIYTICIEPEQKYSIAYHSIGKKGWYTDSIRGFSNVKISIGDTLIYSGHMEGGEYAVESFVYHKSCAENETQATITRNYGKYPLYEPLRIFKGDVAEGNYVMSIYGNEGDQHQERTFYKCFEKGQKYSVVYYSSHNGGWTNNGAYESSMSITYEDELLISGTLNSGNKNYGSFFYPSSCGLNEIQVTLVRQYGDQSHREYFELFKGNESGSFLFGIYGMTSDSGKSLKYTICIEQNQSYTVKYYSIDKNKWSPNSNIDIQYSGIGIFHNGYHDTTIPSETFTVTLPTCAAADEWKETVIGQQAIASCQSDDYEGQRERMCNPQNNTATWGPITDKCTLKAPVISYSQSFYNFTKTEVIDEILPITQNRITSFAIKPSLPDGLFFNTTTGSISGTPSIYSPSTKYTITASNEEKSASVVITISVHSVTCDKKGIWNPIGYGEIAYAFCENSSAVQYRECLLKDSNTYWGEIYDEMCSISILPEEPEKDHAFIQFELAYSEKNPENYTALNMFALYSGLYNYFDGNHMNIDGIVISTESVSLSNEQEGGSVIQFSIGVLESEVETIEEGLADYLKTSYFEDVIEKDPSFGNVPFVFNKRKMVVVHGPVLTSLEIILIIAAIICVLAIIIGAIVCRAVKLRKQRHMVEENGINVV